LEISQSSINQQLFSLFNPAGSVSQEGENLAVLGG
jgi:hypothetical protein